MFCLRLFLSWQVLLVGSESEANAARKNARLSWRLPVRAGCSPLMLVPEPGVTGAMSA
ncbi:hypothetical protein ATK36_6324 [Amycolatopsis sulphurea]|uniref:Uncharacterized protein n=1 Tax=Amycolatopsis sulphurea TaxID=76022 RepID=A0A2A9FKG7_9PSEU|nr:hypothetical protein ATK36_6324 [Amycolatopsis sulphurea]